LFSDTWQANSPREKSQKSLTKPNRIEAAAFARKIDAVVSLSALPSRVYVRREK